MDTTQLKNIDMTAKFSNFKVINKDFTRCRCDVFYTGRNRNYSDITEQALENFINRKGYANVPVVAHLMKDDDGHYHVGGHDSKIVISNEGIECANECVPFGVIPEDCNPSMELITETSGIQRKYFSVDVILWTHRYPIMDAAYSDDIYFNQSMEITFDDYKMDGDYVVINDFSMSALCLLNRSLNKDENIEPCFESSRLKAFSINENKFKENFELMLATLKQYEDDVKNQLQKNNQTKGGNEMSFAKFAEIISAVTFKNEKDEDVSKYRLLSFNENQVIAMDIEDFKPYGFDYTVVTENNEENIIVDYDSKTEMSLSAIEKINEEGFEEFDIQSEVTLAAETKTMAEAKKLEGEFNKRLEKLQSAYSDLSDSFNVATKKIEDYEAKEKAVNDKKHIEDVNAIFEKFASKLDKCAEFLVYKAKVNPLEVTTDEVTEKLTLMAGKYMMANQSKSNFSYTPVESGVSKGADRNATSKYGHLLDKYIN